MMPVGIARAHIWVPKIDVRQNIEPAQWWMAFSAAAAAAWLVEAFKNYGLIPGAHAAVSPTVAEKHQEETQTQISQGYALNQRYTGSYSNGDIAVSDGQRGDNYVAFSTADHPLDGGRRTCTLVHRGPDALAFYALSTALKDKGVPPHIMQAGALPIHGDRQALYDAYGHIAMREAMTPLGGTVRWMARMQNGRPTAVAQVDTPQAHLKANVEYTG
jgi:hypothetical protein